jgi:hypothetical protein
LPSRRSVSSNPAYTAPSSAMSIVMWSRNASPTGQSSDPTRDDQYETCSANTFSAANAASR